MEGYVVNNGKNEIIEVDGVSYRRLCIKTHVITNEDNITDVVQRYAAPLLAPGDILFITEKAVACTQSRAIKLTDIHPRPLARFLCKFVLKTPYGIGLAMPETMEMALKECGTLRILFAAFISAIGKLFRRRGWFYKIAGEKARAIDGPCDCTLPPYNEYVVLAPADPDRVAAELAAALGYPVAITDINDLGGNILGASGPELDRELLVRILKDNPLGQSGEQTPMGIIRRAQEDAPSNASEGTMQQEPVADNAQGLADNRESIPQPETQGAVSDGDPTGQMEEAAQQAAQQQMEREAEPAYPTTDELLNSKEPAPAELVEDAAQEEEAAALLECEEQEDLEQTQEDQDTAQA